VYTHVVEGQIKNAQIQGRSCPSRLIIFEPVDRNIRKAIIIPKIPHNHPPFLHAKPTQHEKELAVAALKAGGNGIGPGALRIG
jgi:hypothetical protein